MAVIAVSATNSSANPLVDTDSNTPQNNRVKSWLKALLSETPLRVWLILSAFSTLVTFFLKGWSEQPFRVSAASTILGFAWANFKVFQNQQSEIARLGAAQRLDEEDRIRDLQELRAVIADGLDLARNWMQRVPGSIPNPKRSLTQVSSQKTDSSTYAHTPDESRRNARGLSSTRTPL